MLPESRFGDRILAILFRQQAGQLLPEQASNPRCSRCALSAGVDKYFAEVLAKVSPEQCRCTV